MHPQYATAGKQTKPLRQRAGKNRHQKVEKIQDISEEKEAPKTTKQTVTLTTVAGQKAQEKSLNETYRLQRRHYKEQIIIMKILVYLTFQESPLHLYYHDNHSGYTTETMPS